MNSCERFLGIQKIFNIINSTKILVSKFMPGIEMGVGTWEEEKEKGRVTTERDFNIS
jgi:hypothetical protein